MAGKADDGARELAAILGDDTKVELLERTVLELGTELFNLKGMVAKTQESHEQFVTIIKGLKQLLDEKGLITRDDFDAAVELGLLVE